MNPNSLLSFSSSLPSHVCPPIPRSRAIVDRASSQTLQGKLTHIEKLYPTVSVLIRRNGCDVILAGERSIHQDLLVLESYVAQFMPTQRGNMTLPLRSIRMDWMRCDHAIVIIGWIRRPDAMRSFEKTVPRTMRSLVRLSKP